MPKFRALIEGRNFLLRVAGKTARHGFYQTVFVEAPDPHAAELEALQVVRDDVDLKAQIHNPATDPPRLALESISAIDDGSAMPTPTGRTYFREKSWWQFW